jgi:hypothetical protein
MGGLLLQFKPHIVHGSALANHRSLVTLSKNLRDKAVGHCLKFRVDVTVIVVVRIGLASPQLAGDLVHWRQGKAMSIIGWLSHGFLLSY